LTITFIVRNEYGIFSVILSPCKPGLGQGHTKKRHLHATQKVSFTYNPEAKRQGDLRNFGVVFLFFNAFQSANNIVKIRSLGEDENTSHKR